MVVSLRGCLVGEGRFGSTPGGEEGKIPSKGGMSGLKVVFYFPLSRLEDMRRVVGDFFLCKRGGEAGKKVFSANKKKGWRKIWCGFFFDCGCNGHRAIRHLVLDCKYYKTQQWRMKQKIKPIPLTWHTLMHTGIGLQAALEFPETTGIGSWTWILGPKKDMVGGFGWSHIRDDGGREEKED